MPSLFAQWCVPHILNDQNVENPTLSGVNAKALGAALHEGTIVIDPSEKVQGKSLLELVLENHLGMADPEWSLAMELINKGVELWPNINGVTQVNHFIKAVQKGATPVLQQLLQSPNCPAIDRLQHLKISLKENLNINGRWVAANRSFPPLHWMTYIQSLPALELLLEHGFDPNLRNEEGVSPLAIIHDQNMIEPLIKNGADAWDVDGKGGGAMAYWKKLSQSLFKEWARVLRNVDEKYNVNPSIWKAYALIKNPTSIRAIQKIIKEKELNWMSEFPNGLTVGKVWLTGMANTSVDNEASSKTFQSMLSVACQEYEKNKNPELRTHLQWIGLAKMVPTYPVTQLDIDQILNDNKKSPSPHSMQLLLSRLMIGFMDQQKGKAFDLFAPDVFEEKFAKTYWLCVKESFDPNKPNEFRNAIVDKMVEVSLLDEEISILAFQALFPFLGIQSYPRGLNQNLTWDERGLILPPAPFTIPAYNKIIAAPDQGYSETAHSAVRKILEKHGEKTVFPPLFSSPDFKLHFQALLSINSNYSTQNLDQTFTIKSWIEKNQLLLQSSYSSPSLSSRSIYRI